MAFTRSFLLAALAAVVPMSLVACGGGDEVITPVGAH
jgi:hypothetical protein